MRCLSLLVVFAVGATSSTVTQSDWSGGAGVYGPVESWDEFYWDSYRIVSFTAGEIQLILPLPPVEYLVCDSFPHGIDVFSEDINGDGYPDILGASQWGDKISWWENSDTSPGVLWTEHTIQDGFPSPSSIHSADIDGDGDNDVLSTSYDANNITWWENLQGTGLSWEEHVIYGDFNGANTVYAADINNDGDIDVIGGARNSDDIMWWENYDGVGTLWYPGWIETDFEYVTSVFTFDLDNDGDLDVLATAEGDNEVAWWENVDSLGTEWNKHSIEEYFPGAQSVCAGDLDGDGDGDVVAAGDMIDAVYWWENANGSGTAWNERVVCGSFNGAASVVLSDIDGDDDLDILGTAYWDCKVSWWENTDGTGLSFLEHEIYWNYYHPCAACPSDFNNDGHLDVVSAAAGANTVNWWDLQDGSGQGDLESSVLHAGQVAEWNSFTSLYSIPAGTTTAFQFRSSNDSADMGVWSDTVFSSSTSLAGILSDSTKYLQYKVIMESNIQGVSPVLSMVEFSYSTFSGLVEQGFVSPLVNVSQNPHVGSITFLINPTITTHVEISIHDMSGRIVTSVSGDYSPGLHTEVLSDLSSGVYFYRAICTENIETGKVVVL